MGKVNKRISSVTNLLNEYTTLACQLALCYNYALKSSLLKGTAMAEKPLSELKTFIEKVNKKDKLSGKRIQHSVTRRKRHGK